MHLGAFPKITFKVLELKGKYNEIRKAVPALPASGSKPQMISALRDYEEKHPERCKLLLDSNQFYGWSKGANLLRKYIQWIYIPAVKDVSTEQDEGSKGPSLCGMRRLFATLSLPHSYR